MTRTERRELIRARLKAKGALLPFAGPKKARRAPYRAQSYFRLIPFAVEPGLTVEWIKKREASEVVSPALRIGRSVKGKTALTKISEQLPKKLPKVNWERKR
jgi:hypothetical protein